MPQSIPKFGSEFFKNLHNRSLSQIAFDVGLHYTGSCIPSDDLENICHKVFDFPIELVRLGEREYTLELFHGPTLAFKDFGARFMAECLGYITRSENQRTVVLVATSGDTGSAVANSFFGVEGVEVVILYPSGKVSNLQEKQLTTLGGNITSLEVNGTFDDCQAMVKGAFENNSYGVSLTSANSINIARLIPQSFYYYWAWARLGGCNVAISVPSGNFGNITGAMLAWETGLPIRQLVASTNINRIVPHYLETGEFKPAPSIETIANAMDVGNPSNFTRLLWICNNNWQTIQDKVSGYWCSDEDIRKHIRNIYEQKGYLFDPHGAIASLGVQNYLRSNFDCIGISVATAHPAKFLDTIKPLVPERVEIPQRLRQYMQREKNSIKMEATFDSLDAFLKAL